MTHLELFLLAIGLSMDAFAVAVCKGLAIKKIYLKNCLVVGLWFGFFQAIMPTIGYLLGSAFAKYIERFDHWIAFVLLIIIGVNMIREAFSEQENDNDSSLSFKTMLPLAVATSIDALAVGVAPLATLELDTWSVVFSVASIGVITFLLSFAGVIIGNKFGVKYQQRAVMLGGVILIVLGIKILVEHLFF